MADRAAGQPHGGAGDRRLAEIERRAAAADAAAQHHQTGFGTTHGFGLARQASFVP